MWAHIFACSWSSAYISRFQGYSFIEQFRDTRPPDIAAHNRRYIKYADRHRIPEDIAKSCVASSVKKDKMKRKRLEERFNLRGKDFLYLIRVFQNYANILGTLYDKKPNTKPKDKSIFSADDFDNVMNLTGNNVLQQKINKIKWVYCYYCIFIIVDFNE